MPNAVAKKSKAAQDLRIDYANLKRLLLETDVGEDLECLSEIAQRASVKPHSGDSYMKLTKAFCDGIEVKLGNVEKEDVLLSKSDLLDEIQKELPELIVKNLMIQRRKKMTYAWFTFTPETTFLTPRIMKQFIQIVEVIEDHAKDYWEYDEQDLLNIELTKCDVAVDLQGAFLPTDSDTTYQSIKLHLAKAINIIFCDPDKNFLSLGMFYGLNVVKGSNNLDTCIQCKVKDA